MYDYEVQKYGIFTDEGQRQFLAIRDHVNDLLDHAGAVRMLEAVSDSCGDMWPRLACVDRMVELGEIREITYDPNCQGQHRIFVRA